MKKTMITPILACLCASASAQNLVVNGDFSAGNTGFTTEYTESCNGSSSLVPEGTYCITSDPSSHHASFSACPDHTSGTGNMMVVNGAIDNSPSNPSQPRTVWSQTVTVTPGQTYNFTLFSMSVNPGSPAHLTLSITGFVGATPATTLTGAPNVMSTTTCSSQQSCFGWNSSNYTSALLRIVDDNQDAGGNDFAIDDIRFYAIATSATPCSIQSLPVTFTSVNAVAGDNNTAVVQWNVASESNIWNYTVQKSTDGKSFTSLGTVMPSQTNAQEKNYFYTDDQFTTSTAYYRIMEKDFDGSEHYSSTITLRRNTPVITDVNVYPNPATDKFTYTLSGNAGDHYSVRLTSLDGRVVYTENIVPDGKTYNGIVSAAALPKGIYLFRAENTQTNNVQTAQVELR